MAHLLYLKDDLEINELNVAVQMTRIIKEVKMYMGALGTKLSLCKMVEKPPGQESLGV